jgi:hypothetical protein
MYIPDNNYIGFLIQLIYSIINPITFTFKINNSNKIIIKIIVND